MKTKLRFLICLVAALAGFMLLSQTALAYTYYTSGWGGWDEGATGCLILLGLGAIFLVAVVIDSKRRANRLSLEFSKAVEARLLPGEKVIAGISAGRSEFVATDKRLFQFSAGRCEELEYAKISEVSYKVSYGKELAAIIGLVFCVVIMLWIVVAVGMVLLWGGDLASHPDNIFVYTIFILCCIVFLGACLWGIKSFGHLYSYYQIGSQTFDKTALKGWRLPCRFARARVDEFVKTIEKLRH